MSNFEGRATRQHVKLVSKCFVGTAEPLCGRGAAQRAHPGITRVVSHNCRASSSPTAGAFRRRAALAEEQTS